MGLIERKWKILSMAIFRNVNPPPIQVQEMRRAFYAGCEALFDILETGVSDNDEVTSSDLNLLENIAKELREFADAVKRGEK